MLRLVENQVTGCARRHDIFVFPGGQGEVTARKRVRSKLVNRHVGSRPTAVPVLEFSDIDVQGSKDRQERFLVGPSGPFQRAAWIVGVGHNASSFLTAVTESSSVAIS